MKKLKANSVSLTKEFEELSSKITNEDFANNPEDGLRKAFRILDQL